MTLDEIASLVGGNLTGSQPEPGKQIRAVRSMQEAGPHDLTFLANPKYRGEVGKLHAGAILLSEQIEGISIPQIVVSDPYLALSRVMQVFYPLPVPVNGIHQRACVASDVVMESPVEVGACAVVMEGCRIGSGTVISAGVYIGPRVTIGSGCLVHPGVVIREDTRIGDRVIIQPNAVVGSDGFGYAADRQGHRHKIPQIGRVVIGDDVEIGANTTIDRATFGETVIGKGTKIDNLVQIAHNVRIGEDCVIVSQAGISGSSRLGHRVILAGQSGVVGHIEIGNDSMVGAQSGVAKSLPEKSRVSGSPAISHTLWLRIQTILGDLPRILTRVRNLEKTTSLSGDTDKRRDDHE
jgi:UDP-3-O-[3-hydroxymyristoyl] glucosamine N-acyltransferase|uniref:UDP-3-O-acylglucosamine N-acyltransferase n=1 Tax=Leptospirillum ferriphilum TaxID=178606 RepID=A0A7C3LSB5_9BACT